MMVYSPVYARHCEVVSAEFVFDLSKRVSLRLPFYCVISSRLPRLELTLKQHDLLVPLRDQHPPLRRRHNRRERTSLVGHVQSYTCTFFSLFLVPSLPDFCFRIDDIRLTTYISLLPSVAHTHSPYIYIHQNKSHNQNAGTAGGSSTTFARPIPLTVGNASNVLIEDITQIGSLFWVSLYGMLSIISLLITGRF